MSEERFEPVYVQIGKLGQIRVIESTRQAAEALLDAKWQARGGPKMYAAGEACLAKLNGQRKAVASIRKAFVEAAREIDVLADAPAFRPHSRK